MGKRKHTNDEIKEFFNNHGFEWVDGNYINSKSKLTLKDKSKYLYYACHADVNQGYIPELFHKSNPYTIKNLELYIKLNNIKLRLLSTKYISAKDKLILIDNDGYLYYGNLQQIRSLSPMNKFDISNIFTLKNIELWLKLNNKQFVLVDNQIYNGDRKYLKWQCLKDGCEEIFDARWNDIISNRNCPFCRGLKVGLSNCLATLNPKLASEWHPTKNGDLTPYDVTLGSSNIDVWWKCTNNPKHEWVKDVYSRNIGVGCPYCRGFYASEDYNLLLNNPELCKEWDYNTNDKRPEEYSPISGEKVNWICKECSCEWNAKISSRNGTVKSGCPECNKSKGEKKCKEIFDLKNISYIPQKEFDGLLGLGGGNLSYDFYILKYNLLVEYQGEYHDQIIKYKNESIETSKERFNRQQEHDKRKKEYAKENKYNFLEIWYWDFNNIEGIITSEIHNIETTKISANTTIESSKNVANAKDKEML
jgi:hypothetical protein